MTADNAQKTFIGTAINLLARNKSLRQIQHIGKNLPASAAGIAGSIITGKFETASSFSIPQSSVPHFGPEYIRYPTQPGDKGVVLGNDTDIGNMSGQGPSQPSGYERPGNTNPGVFFPVANKDWEVSPIQCTFQGQ